MSTNSVVLHHVRTGLRGHTPVVLLHPAGLDLTYWDGQIAALTATTELIACDLPGHGGSPLGDDGWSFARVIRDLLGLLDALGVECAHLVGISVGGMIAQEFALAHPDRVAALTLIATASEFPAEVRAGMRDRARRLREGGMAAVIDETMARWFTADTRANRPDLIDRATKSLLGDDAEAHAQLWEAVAGLDTTSRLRAIAVPTLILAGELDPSCPPPAARLIHARIAGSRLAEVPGASHMVIMERADAVNAELASFLAHLAAG